MMSTPPNKPVDQAQDAPKSKHIATSPFKGKTGVRRLINAFGYSLEGFKAAFVHEDAFRQEVFLAIVLIPLAIYLGHSPVEQALLIASVLLVLIVELLNSAIEAAVDHTSTEHHALAKQAKDIGSAAVFIALLIVAVVWGLILFA
ncbi:diacylglycerol kinase [Methylotenera mobilis]|uniref:Diacylglycerol kinase n=1 Tax=Methylotenera mobilis (strain JLW8 / ATCC BAA-1282 / DSM 17540) TaxID=583345 RepID=C6WT39_METML|nr:diacylglycerol kinase [Methylotenera mobilis]ACT49101.1 diacylglycerol kinase [Methylotenera mobilis JLW8]